MARASAIVGSRKQEKKQQQNKNKINWEVGVQPQLFTLILPVQNVVKWHFCPPTDLDEDVCIGSKGTNSFVMLREKCSFQHFGLAN